MNTTLLSVPFWASVAGLVAVAAFNSWLSRINQFFFFSRSVAPDFASTPPAKKIAADYLRGVWLGCVAGVGVAAFVAGATRLSLLVCMAAGLAVECVYCTAAFARAHRLTGLAWSAGDASQTVPPEEPAAGVALLNEGSITRLHMVQVVLAPVCAAAAYLCTMRMSGMGFSAFDDAITANHADFLSGMSIGLMGASALMAVLIRYFSRHRTPLARFTGRTILALSWCGAALLALCALTVPLHLVITPGIKRGLFAALIVGAILRFLYAWQPARRFTPPPVERSGDEFWRWGLFYYNRADPTLFIQHRAGCGYTVNFANFLSWPLTLAFVADLVFIVCIHPYR